jgi:hypothetical protein
MKITMSGMKDLYKGRMAVVMGGGPSLPGDLQKLGVYLAKQPGDCFGDAAEYSGPPRNDKPISIAVNHHALMLVECDFMVYNDHPDPGSGLEKAVESGQVTRVSPEPTSDVELDMEVWTGFYSSNLATWFALWLGCDPVILCGMDCYQGEKKYFHEYEDKPHLHYPLEHHLNVWVEDARNKLPGWERVKAMSGPLINVFGEFFTAELAENAEKNL